MPDSMPPQVGVGGGTPRPRNDRLELGEDHGADRVVNSTMIGGMMLGRMCRHRMRRGRGADRLRGMHIHVLAHRDHGASG